VKFWLTVVAKEVSDVEGGRHNLRGRLTVKMRVSRRILQLQIIEGGGSYWLKFLAIAKFSAVKNKKLLGNVDI